MSGQSGEVVRALQVLADENESWEWQAPVGPGNASYANGYENGRRVVGAALRALVVAYEDSSAAEHPMVDAVRAYLGNGGITPETLRYAATHESLCRSWIFDLLTNLAIVLEQGNPPAQPAAASPGEAP